jgi:hypothetical protein
LDGKNRKVSTHPNILSGMDSGAALANDNIPRDHVLTCVLFYAPALSIAVTPIAARTTALFVRHLDLLYALERDLVYL